MAGQGHAVEEMRPRRQGGIPGLLRRRDRGGESRRQVPPQAHADDRGGRAQPAYNFFSRNKPANLRPRAGKVNFPSDEDELATGAALAAAAANDEDAEPRATAVVFPDATLGIELKLLEDENRIILLRATDASPAAALAPGLVLHSINGAAVGACRPRDALAISKQIRGTPRPLTLEFVEGA